MPKVSIIIPVYNVAPFIERCLDSIAHQTLQDLEVILADDRGHVQGFKYFSQFKSFNELSEVLLGNVPARLSDNERILAYNIGLGLHDILFASKIYERLESNN